jgi:hypothetical protein
MTQPPSISGDPSGNQTPALPISSPVACRSGRSAVPLHPRQPGMRGCHARRGDTER